MVKSLDIRNLLAIRWNDGMVVDQHHFSHTDSRNLRLFEEILGTVTGGSGLIRVYSNSAIAGQLIELMPDRSAGRPDEHGHTVRILEPFIARTASGRLVIGVPNSQRIPGYPNIEHRIHFPDVRDAGQSLYVCAWPEGVSNSPTLIMDIGQGQELELDLPSMRLSVETESDLLSGVYGHFSDCFVLAKADSGQAGFSVDQQFIPALVKLSETRYFDSGILEKFKTLTGDIRKSTLSYVRLSKEIYGDAHLGQKIRSRTNLIHVLYALILSKIGMIYQVESLSPTQFLNEIVRPLSIWYQDFVASEKEIEMSAGNAIKDVVHISNYPNDRLNTSTSDLLLNSCRMLEKIKDQVTFSA